MSQNIDDNTLQNFHFDEKIQLTKREILFIDTILSSIIKVPELEYFVNQPRQGTSFSLELIDKILEPCCDSFGRIKKYYEDKTNLQNS